MKITREKLVELKREAMRLERVAEQARIIATQAQADADRAASLYRDVTIAFGKEILDEADSGLIG